MMPAIGQWEEISRVSPLGLRFWDTLTDKPIVDGLSVATYPLKNPLYRTNAFPNRSGVYFFQGLPGLHDAEFGQGDDDYWSSVVKKPFVVEVLDNRGRFQRFIFQADLPTRGLFTLSCAHTSPPVDFFNELGIPLYSAPTRNIPSGIAVIRASLRDIPNDQPAAWAMMDALLDGHLLARGLADREGRIVLLFPYPEPVHSVSSPLDSPPIGNRPSLVDQIWSIQLQAYYLPLNPAPDFPDLCHALSQPPIQIFKTLTPASLLTDVSLQYGRELVVRSESQSVVWIGP